jgi:uncharacterized membrane protein YphA (DoxX/SURF4 family)
MGESGRSGRLIGYWIVTGLLAFELITGSVADIVRWQPMAEGMARLGYPMYFLTILGLWKIAGAAALLWPGMPLVKEWAYAGIFFVLTGAVISHAICREWGHVIAPSLLTVLTIVSWKLRPRDRMFGAFNEGDASSR